MAKPFRLNGEGNVAPQPRQAVGRVPRSDVKLPVNPASLPDPGNGVTREMDGWAPRLGQNSAEIRKGNIPWPEVTAEDSAGKA